ncbi:PQQ-dependent dehydrogenase, methanol/ethanol family [Haliea sp. E17]|uniref:PQQ-dependent dehydrogenase, methanol/ethanol family n=1 Tax=Haliea sp. E17 TaxID=3401576 RepID=UPI003AAF73ED
MSRRPAAFVDTEAIADQDGRNWLSYGLDYREQRFSPLRHINRDTVSRLGLAWYFDLDYARGLEGTPIAVDGVLYFTGNWSVVYAVDARDGSLLWKYDPEVPKAWGKMACCDVVNRGVAVYEGKVFVGTLDARLVALDAATGQVRWSVQTADIAEFPYTITGAPRAARGKVFIGNGGAEYGVRGFVSAYDTDSGDLVWRFYTVPGNPAEGFENAAMERAAATWTGEWWRYGGGGTVWDSIVYDPELNQLYIGVGNGSPWNRHIRSPQGGDNLYLSSIIALNPDTGDYLWHYQETPAESWDYTATQQIMLADMEIGGELRKVIWHAPKNGFFFVLDRRDGGLLSAEPYARVNWANRYDMNSGRPVENPGVDYRQEPAMILPSGVGAHNWQPMAHHPGTGLVYIPAMDAMMGYAQAQDYVHHWGHWNTGVAGMSAPVDNDLLVRALARNMTSGKLLAWNPQLQRAAWEVPRRVLWNGGVLATAGDLVFQGTGDGFVVANDAASGDELWTFATQEGVIGSPVSYSVDGKQYLSILVGWGGGAPLALGSGARAEPEHGRLLTFRLDASGELPPLEALEPMRQPPPRSSVDSALTQRGEQLYGQYCIMCHGHGAVSDGVVPDLRNLPAVFYDNFDAIVLDGLMEKAGMVGFRDVLTEADSRAIKAYLLDEANDEWERLQQPAWWLGLQMSFYDLLARVAAWVSS